MLLRNWYNLMAFMTVGANTDATTFGDGHINFRNMDGTIQNIVATTSNYLMYHMLGFCKSDNTSGATGGVSLLIGTGTTPVAFDDYKLSSLIASGWSKASFAFGTPVYNSETKKFTNTVTFVLTNTAVSQLTFSEIGIAAYNSGSILLYREVLDSPQTVAAGTSVNFTQNFEFTMPTIA